MEEEGSPNATCSGCCCGQANRFDALQPSPTLNRTNHTDYRKLPSPVLPCRPESCKLTCSTRRRRSSPLETFTFGTLDSYRAYQAIMAARSGAVRPHHSPAPLAACVGSLSLALLGLALQGAVGGRFGVIVSPSTLEKSERRRAPPAVLEADAAAAAAAGHRQGAGPGRLHQDRQHRLPQAGRCAVDTPPPSSSSSPVPPTGVACSSPRSTPSTRPADFNRFVGKPPPTVCGKSSTTLEILYHASCHSRCDPGVGQPSVKIQHSPPALLFPADVPAAAAAPEAAPAPAPAATTTPTSTAAKKP